MTRILIWGAGAIGGTIGAYLVRAGEDIAFVDAAADHVAAMQQALRVTGPIAHFAVQAPAFTPDRVEGVWDQIWLAVKAHHTEAACTALLPHLAPDGFVLSLQNGLCEGVIAGLVGRPRTIGAFVNFSADWMAPGEIMFGGRGAVVLGELDGRITPRLEALHARLRLFEPDAIVTDDIWSYLWGKLGYGAMLFAQALGEAGIADCLARPELLPLWRAPRGRGGAGRGRRGRRAARLQRLRTRSLRARCDRGAGRGQRRRHGRLQPAQRQDAFRRLARPLGAAPADRDRRADRADRHHRRPPRDRLPDHRPSGDADPRGGAWPAPDGGRQPHGASRAMNIDFAGQVVAVSGAGHGIGRTIAATFAGLGARVFACDLAAAEPVGEWTFATLDLTDRAASAAWIASIEQASGQAIDVLALNAGGVAGQVGRPLEDVSDDDWDRIFAVNVGAAFVLARAAAPAMKRAGRGRIVTTSSGAGLQASLTGIQAYCSAKHAVVGLTRQLAHELGPFGITVNSVAPGLIPSNPTSSAQWDGYGARGQAAMIARIAMQRLGTTQDIANAVVFFASDLASFVNGQVLSVDGGR